MRKEDLGHDVGGSVRTLGPRLRSLADSEDSRQCLEVFADLVTMKSDATRPHFLAVMVRPDGGVEMLTIGHACPGLTIEVGSDLELTVPQLWADE